MRLFFFWWLYDHVIVEREVDMKIVFAELESGEQEFFERLADALDWARTMEEKKRHSVDYVAVGDTDSDELIVYKGQDLRNRLRAGDLRKWINIG